MINYLIKFLIRISASRSVRIVSIYFIVSVLWIFFSDTLISNLPITEDLRTRISIIKGLFYVIICSWILLFLIRTALKEATNLNKQVNEAEAKYKLIANNSTDVIWNYNIKNERLTYISPSIEKLLGYNAEEILELTLRKIFTEKSYKYISLTLTSQIVDFEKNLEPVRSQMLEVEHLHKNGSIIPVEAVLTLIKDESGKAAEIVGITRDITDRKRLEHEREITFEFLNLINLSSSLKELIQSTVNFFQKHSGCQAVGIRLQEGNDYPYYFSNGFSPQFISQENYLCSRNSSGIELRDSEGNPVLECMCGNIISGRYDPLRNYFTKNGSYWTNSTTDLLLNATGNDIYVQVRNRCNSSNYESVALIPVRFGEKTFGLVQLNDTRNNIFTIDAVLMWERITGYLAVAVSKFYADADLYKSEERYKYLFENMVEGFAYCMMLYDHDTPVDFVYINVNDKFEQLTGLKNAVGKKVTHLIPGIKESNPELFEIYGRVASTGVPERFESYVPPLHMWFSISVYSPKKDFFVAVFDVITERKRAEEALRKSEELLKITGSMAKVGGWEFDAVTLQGTWTEEVARIHDLDPNLTTTVELGVSFYHGESRIKIEKAIKEAIEFGIPYDLELEMITAKGNHKWVRTISRPIIKDGRVIKMTGSFQDITERKKAAAELLESEERYRSVYNNSSIAILLTNPESGEILAANNFACKLFGMTDQEICRAGRMGLVDVNDPRLITLLEEREDVGESMGRLTFIKKDGSKFEGEISSAIFYDRDGNKRTSMIIQDLTEKLRAEEEILKSRTQYRELAAHLQTIREEERTAIAREMHDELGQILSSIKMNLVLIHRQVEDRENTNYQRIQTEIESLNKTIDNAVARVRKLITQLRPELLDKLGLIPAIEWYIQEYNKEVKIKCELLAEFEESNLDSQKELAIFRIIQESLTNAAKYSGASLILVKLYRNNGQFNVEIVDNGKGIENTKLIEGKTFGLLGMRERANLIGGQLFIDSEPGKGTKIKLVV